MAKNSKVHCIGLVEVVPSSKVTTLTSNSTTSKGGLNQFETSTKSVYKDQCDGSSYSFSKKHKGGEFIDGRSGRYGYKEEVSYKSSVKVDDAWTGCTDEYQTEVKFQKTTTYPSTSSNSKRFSPYSKSSKSKRISYY